MLARTQETLLGFQADLGGISDEIRHLQQQSLKMGVQLRNRRAAEARVSAFLERMVLPPGAAKHLCEGEVGDVYLEVGGLCQRDLALCRSDSRIPKVPRARVSRRPKRGRRDRSGWPVSARL